MVSNSSYTYRTLSEPVYDVEFKDRGSSFIAYAKRITDIEEAKSFLLFCKQKHPKASHHCYAYRLGLDKNNYRAVDDGEPSKSAGYPILGQIDSFELSNVMLVVVRYFGGTLLGVPGLVNAYKNCAKLCLLAASIQTEELCQQLALEFDYTLQNEVLRICKENKVNVRLREELLFCRYTVEIPMSQYQAVLAKFQHLYGLTIL